MNTTMEVAYKLINTESKIHFREVENPTNCTIGGCRARSQFRIDSVVDSKTLIELHCGVHFLECTSIILRSNPLSQYDTEIIEDLRGLAQYRTNLKSDIYSPSHPWIRLTHSQIRKYNIPRRDWIEKLAIAQGRCGICDDYIVEGESIDIDHIMPKSKGGADEYENLQIAHSSCNSLKSNIVDYKPERN